MLLTATALLCALVQAPAEESTPRVEDTLIVLNKSDATASLLDPETGALRHLVATGLGPHEAVVTPDGLQVIVADYGAQEPGSTLTVIELATGQVARKISLKEHDRPHGLVFAAGSGHLLVTAENSRALLEVDVDAGRVVRAIETGERDSHMVAVTPDGLRAFVANIGPGSVSAIDLEEGVLLRIVPTGAGCEGIDVAPDGGEVWTSNRAAGTVSVLDANSLEVVAELEAPGFPIRVKLTPDGKHALVSCALGQEVLVFDAGSRELVHRIAMQYEPVAGAEKNLFGKAFAGKATPIGIQLRPDGKRAFVANANANLVAVLDLESMQVVGTLETGNEPDGLAWATAR